MQNNSGKNKASYLPVVIVAGVIAAIFFVINAIGFIGDIGHDNYISTFAMTQLITIVVGVPAIIIIPGIVAITIKLKNSSKRISADVAHNKKVIAIRVLASINIVMLAMLIFFCLAGASSGAIDQCVLFPTYAIELAILILALNIKDGDFPASVLYQDIVRIVALLLYRREFLNYLNSMSFYYHHPQVPFIGAAMVLVSYFVVVKFEDVFPPFARKAFFVCEGIMLLRTLAAPILMRMF